MVDIVDLAQDVEERFREQALSRFARRRATQHEGRPQPRDCDDCGDAIPAARLSAIPEARRCCDCQQSHERGM